MPHTGCGMTRTGSTGNGSLLCPGYGRIGGTPRSTGWITGEVGLVARSSPQQAEDSPTQLADLVTRLIVLGHLDVGDDTRRAL